jgi:DNA repair exonuclease SbcCD ATPase subunit
MDLSQLAKMVDWLESERRKDKQEITALQERLSAALTENTALARRVQQLENGLSAANTQIQRFAKVDEILDGYRKEMTRQLEELDKRWAEAARDEERLRKVERDGVNKSLGEVRKGLEGISKIERDALARREEEGRIARLVADLQKKVMEFTKYLDERHRAVTLVEEGRRQDAKRIADLQGEMSDLRRRADENRSKLEIIEDVARRAETRIAEVITAEQERRAVQTQWMESQSIRQAEQERAWVELKARLEAANESMDDYARRVNQYAETNREMARASVDLQQAAELLERRMNEVSEIQRLAEDRIRQDWAAFLADDQKRWTTHMLLRDEQWREHDRVSAKQVEQVEAIEEQMNEVLDALRHMQEQDAHRLHTLLKVVREMTAEYDQQFAKVR